MPTSRLPHSLPSGLLSSSEGAMPTSTPAHSVQNFLLRARGLGEQTKERQRSRGRRKPRILISRGLRKALTGKLLCPDERLRRAVTVTAGSEGKKQLPGGPTLAGM